MPCGIHHVHQCNLSKLVATDRKHGRLKAETKHEEVEILSWLLNFPRDDLVRRYAGQFFGQKTQAGRAGWENERLFILAAAIFACNPEWDDILTRWGVG
jgi:hypothetical protein